MEIMKILHAIFPSPKRLFPFLRQALGRPVSSSKELLSLNEAEQTKLVALARFVEVEEKLSWTLEENDGIMHRSFLRSASMEQFRLLWMLRRGRKICNCGIDYSKARSLRLSMLAKGAWLGKSTPVEEYFSEQVRNDQHLRSRLAKYYTGDGWQEFYDAARTGNDFRNMDADTVEHLCALYFRETCFA